MNGNDIEERAKAWMAEECTGDDSSDPMGAACARIEGDCKSCREALVKLLAAVRAEAFEECARIVQKRWPYGIDHVVEKIRRTAQETKHVARCAKCNAEVDMPSLDHEPCLAGGIHDWERVSAHPPTQSKPTPSK